MSEWKLVPREPTPEMIAEGRKADFVAATHDTAPLVYRAMISAAPAAPQSAEPANRPVDNLWMISRQDGTCTPLEVLTARGRDSSTTACDGGCA